MARARIRTVKPELYRHKKLFDLEKETGLPMRLAWSGIFMLCDREGRFKWEPVSMKLDVLPYDELDFSWVLDALTARGFIVKYREKISDAERTETHVHAREDKFYGYIPTFLLHQKPNAREARSVLPDPKTDGEAIKVDFPVIPQRTCTHVQDNGELELEGNWKGNRNKDSAGGSQKKPQRVSQTSNHEKTSGPTTETWSAFQKAYEIRYRVRLNRNQKISGQLSQFITRIPKGDAPEVAAFYVRHNDRRYTSGKHPVGLLLQDAERLWTEWKTNRPTTSTEAAQLDKKQSRFNAFQNLITEAEAREAADNAS